MCATLLHRAWRSPDWPQAAAGPQRRQKEPGLAGPTPQRSQKVCSRRAHRAPRKALTPVVTRTGQRRHCPASALDLPSWIRSARARWGRHWALHATFSLAVLGCKAEGFQTSRWASKAHGGKGLPRDDLQCDCWARGFPITEPSTQTAKHQEKYLQHVKEQAE